MPTGEVDYFHFWLSHQRVVRLRIRRLDYNADLYLENRQGTVIASSEKTGDQREILNVTLAPTGADEPYYIRVEAREDGRNDYEFRYLTGMPANASPSGLPVITGTAQVGKPLSVDTSGISDPNGLTNVQYSYQWVRNDGSTDTNIPGATGQTYTLTDDELNNTIKVRVSFTDDAGYTATLTSAVTGRVPRSVDQAPTGLPTVTGTAQVHETLSADTSGISDPNGLTNPQYNYQWIRNDGNSDTTIAGATSSSYTLTDADLNNTIKVKVSFTDDAGYTATLTSNATGSVARPADEAPTGLPTITGTPWVGETLSADTSGISDGNGLSNPQYSYQWVRNDGNSDTSIPGATGQTHTLTDDDLNSTVKVSVSFTDDDGYTATLTSAATGSVTRRPDATPGGLPTITGTAEVGETLSADTSGISDPNGLTNPQYSYQWIRIDGDSDTNIPDATGQTYTLTDDEAGKAVKVQVSFTDDDGYSHTLTSAATDILLAAQEQNPANTPAAGLPTIDGSTHVGSGTAHVGEMLTAGTSRIRDANGLTNVSYNYRWLLYNEDTHRYEYISGATSSTYTIAASDEGKAIRVNVSFDDDAGYSESQTSNPTWDVVKPADAPTGGTFVSEGSTDLAAGTGTAGRVSVGGEPRLQRMLFSVRGATGKVSPQDDRDWYKIDDLKGGKNYRIAVLGRDNGLNRSLVDTKIFGVLNSSGTKISGTANDNSVGSEARVYFVPSADGTYFISVGAGRGDTGSYQLIVQEVPVDVSGDTSTTGTITATLPSADTVEVLGEIDKHNDVDWYKLTATANKGYIIDMTGGIGVWAGVASNGSHPDIMIDGVYDADGDFIAGTQDDDGRGGIGTGSYDDARSYFTATTAGNYYIAVKGSARSTGSYRVWVTEVDPDVPGDSSTTAPITVGGSVTGSFELVHDRDAFKATLDGGTTYKFTIGGCRNGDFVGIYDSNGALVQNSAYSGSSETFTPDSTGTYVVVARTDGSSFPVDVCDYTVRLMELT